MRIDQLRRQMFSFLILDISMAGCVKLRIAAVAEDRIDPCRCMVGAAGISSEDENGKLHRKVTYSTGNFRWALQLCGVSMPHCTLRHVITHIVWLIGTTFLARSETLDKVANIVDLLIS